MPYLDNLVITLISGGAAGAVVIWLSKNLIQERIKQSIHNEYQEHIEKFKSSLKLRSDFESGILSTHVKVYWELGDHITSITHKTLQLLSRCGTVMEQEKINGKSDQEIINSLNEFFSKESIPIIENSMLLKRYYVLLPVEVIYSLKEFETIIWNILKEHNFRKSSEIIEAHDKLLLQIRSENSKLLSDEVKLSDIFKLIPENGFIPQYIKKSMQGNFN